MFPSVNGEAIIGAADRFPAISSELKKPCRLFIAN